jgi:predicted Rossmann fold nucleotide-binding protein DprA/Smf involved in DNA uptake
MMAEQPRPQSGRAGLGRIWNLQSGEAGCPANLARAWHGKPPVVHGIGNREILGSRCLGLICSVQCPGSVVIKTFDAIRELRDAGVIMAGGFHSPMEQDCLDFLLRGHQPVLICAARGLGRMRLPAAWREAVDAGRLLLLSPFGDTVTRPRTSHAEIRNEFVAALADVVLIPHASPGGKAEALANRVIERGQLLFTLDDDQNGRLVSIGGRRYNCEEIRVRLASAGTQAPQTIRPFRELA